MQWFSQTDGGAVSPTGSLLCLLIVTLLPSPSRVLSASALVSAPAWLWGAGEAEASGEPTGERAERHTGSSSFAFSAWLAPLLSRSEAHFFNRLGCSSTARVLLVARASATQQA